MEMFWLDSIMWDCCTIKSMIYSLFNRNTIGEPNLLIDENIFIIIWNFFIVQNKTVDSIAICGFGAILEHSMETSENISIKSRIWRGRQPKRNSGTWGSIYVYAITFWIVFLYFYPRPVLAVGYCRCLRLSVCASVCAVITSLSAR